MGEKNKTKLYPECQFFPSLCSESTQFLYTRAQSFYVRGSPQHKPPNNISATHPYH